MTTETETVFLNDPTIPPLEKKGENPNRMRLYVPTKVIDTLGTGILDIQKGTLTLRAIAMVRRCTVIKGLAYTAEEEPQDGILLDGGIVIIDSSGKRTKTVGNIWTLSDNSASDPDKILRGLVMGASRSLVTRVDMIMEGYRQQDAANRKRDSDRIIKARNETIESRFGTFGRGQ